MCLPAGPALSPSQLSRAHRACLCVDRLGLPPAQLEGLGPRRAHCRAHGSLLRLLAAWRLLVLTILRPITRFARARPGLRTARSQANFGSGTQFLARRRTPGQQDVRLGSAVSSCKMRLSRLVNNAAPGRRTCGAEDSPPSLLRQPRSRTRLAARARGPLAQTTSERTTLAVVNSIAASRYTPQQSTSFARPASPTVARPSSRPPRSYPSPPLHLGRLNDQHHLAPLQVCSLRRGNQSLLSSNKDVSTGRGVVTFDAMG